MMKSRKLFYKKFCKEKFLSLKQSLQKMFKQNYFEVAITTIVTIVTITLPIVKLGVT